MTPEDGRPLSLAFADLGARDNATALRAARAVACLTAAAGVKPAALAAMVVAHATRTQMLRARPFADLGPKAVRKRLVELSRRRGVSDQDKASILAMRARWEEETHPEMSASEQEWLDRLWSAPVPAKPARASKEG